ncbi:transient receptor potential cation channel protein painless-like [Culicoides brevitarsis]|uniref:transient receptor potential cation channel protein painless-like n=1 Tax=Culicoides brevitarsis TaxID=469753 RepID=UPI00307B8704
MDCYELRSVVVNLENSDLSDSDNSDFHSNSDSDFDNLTHDSFSPTEKPKNPLHDLMDTCRERNFSPEKTNIWLNKLILISPCAAIDELDNGGSCILHKMLDYFIEMNYKDTRGVDVVELMLNKSNLDYREYQKGIVLSLLQNYDKNIDPQSIKFLQWQILSREGEKIMERWILQNDESRDVKKFVCNVHKATRDNVHLDDMVESILSSGSLQLLKYVKKVVEENKISLVTPIIINAVCWGTFAKPDNVPDFRKCFEYLLKTADKQELCIKDEDKPNSTALGLADAFKDEFMVKALLAKGAPISIRDYDGKFPIENCSVKMLQRHFDSLITLNPTTFLEDESVWKLINAIYQDEYQLQGFIFVNFASFSFYDEEKVKFKDLDLIYYFSESPRLNRLIDHPVPAILLELHWNRFKKWIFLDQVAVIYIIVACLGFFVKYFLNLPPKICETSDYISAALSTFFLLLNLLKSYQVFDLIKTAIKNLYQQKAEINYHQQYPIHRILTSFCLKMPLLILMIYYAVNHCDHHVESCKQTIGAAIILLSINVTFFIAYFCHTVAHYVIMFMYVAATGLKFICSMILILIGMGVGLLMFIKNFGYDPIEESDSHNSTLWAKKAGLSVFRAFVMATGELEAGNLDFFSTWSYLVLIVFIFTVPIVFFNLLNGLAIEDIAEIKSRAAFWHRKTQLMILNEFQKFYGQINHHLKIVKHYDISVYPNIIGEKTFIGINTLTQEVFKMTGLTPEERTLVGKLSDCNVSNAEEILRNRHQL